MNPTQKFNKIIQESFHEILKPLGFKKKGNNFYLQLETASQIINVQKSAYGNKDNTDNLTSTLAKLIVYGEYNQPDKAKREYEKLLKDKLNPQFLTKVKSYGQKYGLDK